MKAHLKRHNAPTSWKILRQERKFTTRPNTGGQPIENGLPLLIILRDKLELGRTKKEVRSLLHNNEILIDGVRKKDHSTLVGFGDVLSIPKTKKYYRLTFDRLGYLTVVEIQEKESATKISKVVGKSLVKGGKIQLHLHDGCNILSDDNKIKSEDSVVLKLPGKKIEKHLPFEEGALVFLMGGNYKGRLGVLKEIKDDRIFFEGENKQNVSTLKKYSIVVGKTKSLITIIVEK